MNTTRGIATPVPPENALGTISAKCEVQPCYRLGYTPESKTQVVGLGAWYLVLGTRYFW